MSTKNNDTDAVTVGVSDEQIREAHGVIVSLTRRSVAIAVVLGDALESKWAKLGKGHFGRWLSSVGISDSAGNRYRNVARKRRQAIKAKPNDVDLVALEVTVLGHPAEEGIKIPTSWRGKSLTQIAHPGDPDEVKANIDPGKQMEGEWHYRLDPEKLQADLESPACGAQLPLDTARKLHNMWSIALRRLLESGEIEATRDELSLAIDTLIVFFDELPGPGDDNAIAELAQREGDRLAGEQSHQDRHLEVVSQVRLHHEMMSHPMTLAEIAEDVSKSLGVGVTAVRVRLSLGNYDRWQEDTRYIRPPSWEHAGYGPAEQRDIATGNGWSPPSSRKSGTPTP